MEQVLYTKNVKDIHERHFGSDTMSHQTSALARKSHSVCEGFSMMSVCKRELCNIERGFFTHVILITWFYVDTGIAKTSITD